MWQLHCLKSIGIWLFILSFGTYLEWWSPKIRQQLDGESMAGYAGPGSIMQRKVSCCSPRQTMRWARRSESEIGLWKAMAKCGHVRPVRIEHQVVGDFSWLYIRFPFWDSDRKWFHDIMAYLLGIYDHRCSCRGGLTQNWCNTMQRNATQPNVM